MKPLVIIPALNEEQTIEKVIRAVLDQKIKLEILIVDGYSVDNTVPVVRELARKRSNIHLYISFPRKQERDSVTRFVPDSDGPWKGIMTRLLPWMEIFHMIRHT